MRWKKIAIAAALAFVVFISALYAFIEFYDFNKFKPLITKVVKDATGRELTIKGDIEINFGIRPTMVIEDVSFQNASWGSRADLGKVKRLETQIAVWPLILGKIDLVRLVLVEPEVIVEFDRAGKSNFSFDTGGNEPEETKITPPPLIFSSVLIEKGLFTYQDAESGFKLSAAIDRMTARIPGFTDSLQIDYKGTIDDIPLSLNGTVGPIWAWVEKGYSWPVNLTATAGKATATIMGQISEPINLKGLSFDFSGHGSSVSEIARLAGLSGMPEFGAFELMGNLSGSADNLAVEKLDIQIGSRDLAAITLTGELKDVLDLRGMKLEFTAKGSDLSKINKMGAGDIPFKGAFNVTAQLVDPAPKVYKITAFNAVWGDNNQTGWLELDVSRRRPHLKGELSSDKLDLRPFIAWEKQNDGANAETGRQAAETNSKSKSETRPPRPDASKTKIFSADPLPLEGLQAIDADFKLRDKQVLLPSLALDDVTMDVLLKNGDLEIKPFKFTAGGGEADVGLAVRSQEKPAVLTATLKVNRLETGPMLDKLGYQRHVEGNMDAALNLDGSGDSVAALMAGLNGNIRLTMSNGQVDSRYLELLEKYLGSGILHMLNPFEAKRKYTPVNCFVNKVEIKNGLADIKILLDTDHTSIFSAGDIDLKTEKLNIGIKPSPKKGAMPGDISFSLGGLSKPFKLGGTLADPHLVIDPGGTAFLIGKFAGALALGPIGIAAFFADVSLGKKDLCASALESAKQEDQPSKVKASSQETAVKNEKKKEKKSGGFFDRLFGK